MRKKCATHRTHRLVLSPVSLGGSSHFLWKRCAMFNRWKIISISLVSSLKTEEVCACCYFCRIIDLTEYFIVKHESILKHQKLLLQDVKLGAWVLKNPLIGKDQQIRRKIALSPLLNRETASLPFTRVLRVLSAKRLWTGFYVIIRQRIDLKYSSTYGCPLYWESEAFIGWTNKKKTITRLLGLPRLQLHK